MASTKGIYKRNNIYWIRYAGPDGKIRRESSYSSRFKDAQTLLNTRRKDAQDGKEPIPIKRIKNNSFKDLSTQYLAWAERQRAFNSKRYLIQGLVNEFGNLPLRRINVMLVEGFQTQLLASGKKPATSNRYLATLKHMFTKAVEWDMVEEDVAKRLNKVKNLQENNRRLRYLSKEESDLLIQSCAPHLRPIVIAALNTGMRKGEILSLEWEKHIDLKNGLILLDKTKNGERREIPINQTLRETLQMLVRRLGTPYVFTDSNGNPFKEVKKSYKTALKKAGIKDFTFHDLRHTFASRLVMAGADLVTVKELLGHKTLAMTLRYSHLASSHKAQAVSLLDSGQSSSAQKVHNPREKGLTLSSQAL